MWFSNNGKCHIGKSGVEELEGWICNRRVSSVGQDTLFIQHSVRVNGISCVETNSALLCVLTDAIFIQINMLTAWWSYVSALSSFVLLQILKSVICVMAPIVLLKDQKANRNDEKTL